MSLPIPKAEVYRLAAKILSDPQSERYFSCSAVSVACDRLGVSYYDKQLYLAQYRAMFGDYVNPSINQAGGGAYYMKYDRLAYFHPYWNKDKTPERQRMRITALLFMAAMVENPA
jgi:hypothetical protein